MNDLENLVWQKVISYKGKTIRSIYRIHWTKNQETDETQGDLQILFKDQTVAFLRVSSNGSTPLIEDKLWQDPFLTVNDIDTQEWIEKYGKDEIFDISNDVPYKLLIDKPIIDIRPIYFRELTLSGFQFEVDNHFLNFICEADESKVLWGKTNSEMESRGFSVK